MKTFDYGKGRKIIVNWEELILPVSKIREIKEEDECKKEV